MLQELKNKWFIDVSGDDQFPPQARHPDSQLQPHTDGNLVEPVIDGAPLMAEFYRRARAIIEAPDPAQHQLWIAQWRLDPVKLLGATSSAEDAETMILEVARAGAKVFFLGSGHTGRVRPTRAFAEKLIAAGGQGAADKRIPTFGSQHQKFYVFRGPANEWLALLGSADLNYSRWDTPGHVANNPDRSSQGEGPSHDVTLRVQGPAVHDIALSFAERWNDGSCRQHTVPQISSTISTDFLNEPLSPTGPHSVQVLRTYGRESRRAYSWSHQGEFTVWAAYLKAIKQAEKYIYIEDQYFYPFSKPSAYNDLAGKRRDSDIVSQLSEAIKRGVDVICLVPSRKGSSNPTNIYQLQARREGAQFLKTIAESRAGAGRFVICNLVAGEVDPVIHAKLMIVDDEFALVGSANVCQRSMAYDTEIHLGVVDAQNQFARDLRLALWQEHLDLSTPDSLLDSSAGIDAFRSNAASNAGRLQLFPAKAGHRFLAHGLVMNNFMDPYRGPDRN
jgi:phosphatidylserine/phosphatidylglycerophosphate/cardiolipin synthase-like enzyme